MDWNIRMDDDRDYSDERSRMDKPTETTWWKSATEKMKKVLANNP